MTTQHQLEDELAQHLEATTDNLRDAGMTPTDTEVKYSDSELWGYIWLAETPADTLTARKETATEILREQINTNADILPTAVNINYGNAGDYGIAVWWSNLTMTDAQTDTTQRIDPNQFYVSNGKQTVGPYTSEARAYRRKYRYNNEDEYDGTWLVFYGEQIRDADDIPLPE